MNNDQLTEAEIAELRKLIEDDKRMRWLWASMRFQMDCGNDTQRAFREDLAV
jgi:hypothetical protein